MPILSIIVQCVERNMASIRTSNDDDLHDELLRTIMELWGMKKRMKDEVWRKRWRKRWREDQRVKWEKIYHQLQYLGFQILRISDRTEWRTHRLTNWVNWCYAHQWKHFFYATESLQPFASMHEAKVGHSDLWECANRSMQQIILSPFKRYGQNRCAKS